MFLATPTLLAITAIANFLDLPATLIFQLSRPSLEKAAITQLKGPDRATAMRSVGHYSDCDFSREGNTVTIAIEGAGYLDRFGFAYCTAGKPAAAGRLTHISGPWYKWWLRF